MPTARWAVVAVVLAVSACAPRAASAPRALEARLALPTRDTVLIRATATAQRCERGKGLLLVGMNGDAGVLLWARAPGFLPTGDYQVLARGDSTTPRGATVSVRFAVAGSPRGVTLDSGSVSLTVSGGRVSARVRGSGLEPATGGVRAGLDAVFQLHSGRPGQRELPAALSGAGWVRFSPRGHVLPAGVRAQRARSRARSRPTTTAGSWLRSAPAALSSRWAT